MTVRLAKYLKRAFTNKWNLLGFLGAAGFAVLSGAAPVLLPIVVAGEVAYLGFLGGHPKFQRYVDAQEAKQNRLLESSTAVQSRNRIMDALPEGYRRQFESLRTRCLEIRRIALDLKGAGSSSSEHALEALQLQGLDRLLWIYLRLLYTHYSLDRFLKTTSEAEIEADIKRLEQKLSAETENASPDRAKIRQTLEDNLQTCHDRLSNLKKARTSHELVELELDRLENKIQTLSELAINRQEPDYIVSQVDLVASSMMDTEAAMNDLAFATGLPAVVENEAIPDLLHAEPVEPVKAVETVKS